MQSNSAQGKRLDRKRRREEQEKLPLMKNLYAFRSRPQQPLGPYRDQYGQMINDVNRRYCEKLTHFYSWELEELAEMVKNDVEAARETDWKNPDRLEMPQNQTTSEAQRAEWKRKTTKSRSYEPIGLCLNWLSTGDTADRREFNNSWAKSSCDEDRKHVLKAICKALKDEIKWPTEQERAEHHSSYNAIFNKMVGIFDVTEWTTCKWKNQELENATFSGKKSKNTMKTLVRDHY